MKNPRRDPDALFHVVVGPARSVVRDAISFLEEHHEPGGDLQERFPPVGVERLERLPPLRRHAAPLVVLSLLGFGGSADAAFDGRVANEHEAPRLAVSAGGGPSRRSE